MATLILGIPTIILAILTILLGILILAIPKILKWAVGLYFIVTGIIALISLLIK